MSESQSRSIARSMARVQRALPGDSATRRSLARSHRATAAAGGRRDRRRQQLRSSCRALRPGPWARGRWWPPGGGGLSDAAPGSYGPAGRRAGGARLPREMERRPPVVPEGQVCTRGPGRRWAPSPREPMIPSEGAPRSGLHVRRRAPGRRTASGDARGPGRRVQAVRGPAPAAPQFLFTRGARPDTAPDAGPRAPSPSRGAPSPQSLWTGMALRKPSPLVLSARAPAARPDPRTAGHPPFPSRACHTGAGFGPGQGLGGARTGSEPAPPRRRARRSGAIPAAEHRAGRRARHVRGIVNIHGRPVAPAILISAPRERL